MTQNQGLTMNEVKKLQEKYGRNIISTNKKKLLMKRLSHIFSEPIYLLLTFAAMIYYILGDGSDGAVMIAFVIFVVGIDLFQDIRTGNALKKLREISTPEIKVIREGREMFIKSEELVKGDLMLISEGMKIPADGYLITASGLCIDESILTGESLGVWKSEQNLQNYCYTGTLVILGTGTVMVEKIGNETEYGKIANQITDTNLNRSALQKQMNRLTKQCTYFAAILFVLVAFVTFINLSELVPSERIIHSLLAGVVLALSMIPGEFPVILTVFLSMGALRLAKKKALVRQLPAVETIGAVSVLCMDKTGTITQNNMKVAESYVEEGQEGGFCKILKLACKEGTYDPVEKAMLDYGQELCKKCQQQEKEVFPCSFDRKRHILKKEYAFTNERKAMGQVWEENKSILIAAKGSPESILSLCILSSEERNGIEQLVMNYLKKGLRVIAIAGRYLTAEDAIPNTLSECRLFLRGIIGLADPVRVEMKENIEACNKAGIRIVMITGDHPVTAAAIAKEVGILNSHRVITGNEISTMSEEKLREQIKECNLFARVLPLHKMRIVKAFQDNGEIVAMTGDGVNDSPAQKMADIGIAMGKHGSEVCREAADLILLDDNFSTVVDTIKDGRRIYQNILKTIEYVLAFHVPIALISLVVPLLGIGSENLMLLPIHIVLLELIMDPTCSVALERQPCEDNIMDKPPRGRRDQLMSKRRFLKSMLQGFTIFLASFGIYYIMILGTYTAEVARTAGIAVLVAANIMLVLENCSEIESLFTTIKKIRNEKGFWIVIIVTILMLIGIIYSPLHVMLKFAYLSMWQLILVFAISAVSVFWYEGIKGLKRNSCR